MAVKPNNIFVDSILYVVVGVTIGSVMAFAAGSFLWAAASINTFSKTAETFIDGELPRLVPAFFLLGSAGLILILRWTLRSKRFHPPRETIAAVQSEKPLDIKGGLGSTLAALIAVGGRPYFDGLFHSHHGGIHSITHFECAPVCDNRDTVYDLARKIAR